MFLSALEKYMDKLDNTAEVDKLMQMIEGGILNVNERRIVEQLGVRNEIEYLLSTSADDIAKQSLLKQLNDYYEQNHNMSINDENDPIFIKVWSQAQKQIDDSDFVIDYDDEKIDFVFEFGSEDKNELHFIQVWQYKKELKKAYEEYQQAPSDDTLNNVVTRLNSFDNAVGGASIELMVMDKKWKNSFAKQFDTKLFEFGETTPEKLITELADAIKESEEIKEIIHQREQAKRIMSDLNIDKFNEGLLYNLYQLSLDEEEVKEYLEGEFGNSSDYVIRLCIERIEQSIEETANSYLSDLKNIDTQTTSYSDMWVYPTVEILDEKDIVVIDENYIDQLDADGLADLEELIQDFDLEEALEKGYVDFVAYDFYTWGMEGFDELIDSLNEMVDWDNEFNALVDSMYDTIANDVSFNHDEYEELLNE